MNEGYLIPLLTPENRDQVDLLSAMIKAWDPSRKIAAVSKVSVDDLPHVDEVIVLDELVDDTTFNYFLSLLNSPFDKTIAFYPDQVLTAFNTGVWESLRGLGSMVVLSSRSAFNGDPVPESQYWKGDIEIKSFGMASNLNAIYFDKQQDAKDILGFAIALCGNYNHDAALEWVNEKNSQGDELFLPFFPEFLWPEWIISFIRTVSSDKIISFDFLDSIDLGKQEMNQDNIKWNTEHWNRFLSYWVTDAGELKIENFIQLGLIRYHNSGWLSDDVKNKLKRVNG